jgi:hypothetical protein
MPEPRLTDRARHSRLAPLTTYRSPMERALRRLHDPDWTAEERVVRGRTHVMLGIGLAMTSLLLWMTVVFATSARWDWRAIGLAATYGVVGAGVLAGSGIARIAMLFHALASARMFWFMLVVLSGFRHGFDVKPLLFAGISGLYLAGTALANLTPAANAYHAAQVARREARKASKRKSLDEWRNARR